MKEYGRRITLIFISITLILLSTLVANATVYSGNLTINDSQTNYFNFTSQSIGASGHILLNDSSVSAVSNTGIRFQGFLPWDIFLDDYVKAPNITYVDQANNKYKTNFVESAAPEKMFAFTIPNTGTVGEEYYAAIYIHAVNGTNTSLFYYYNDISGNNTFAQGEDPTCNNHADADTCLQDMVNDCIWKDQWEVCQGAIAFDNIDHPAECGVLPQFACDNINDTHCVWNSNSGEAGFCEQGAQFNTQYGFNCTSIINDSVCNNAPFTEKTGLCTWNYTSNECYINNTKSFESLSEPPAFFCESPYSSTNQTRCEELATTYFMPCGWNNATDRCEDRFFNSAQFKDFGEITNQNSCQVVGGTWKSETTFDPINNKLTGESWCEYATNIKKFSSVGGGQGSFTGQSGQIKDCSRDCFACEFNTTVDPNNNQPIMGDWADNTSFVNACTNSAAGCRVVSDTNAFNQFGWCEPVNGFGGFNCEEFCGDCNLLPDAQSSCTNSPANCKWDNVTSVCIPQGQKGCNQECFQCQDESSCQSSDANGGCTWDSDSNFCTPQGGDFEICFDGVDNDNNGNTDCDDFKCGSDPFCAGSNFAGASCNQYVPFAYGSVAAAQGNCSLSAECSWITDRHGGSFCGWKGEQCFRNITIQNDAAACNSFGGGNVCIFEDEATCDMNKTLSQNCFGANQATCNTLPACSWNGNFCEFAPIVYCDQNQSLQSDRDTCQQAGCVWIGDSFGGEFEGGFSSSCVAPCFNESINDANSCGAASGSHFPAGICEFRAGFCEPENDASDCPDLDGAYLDCTENPNCNWFADSYGPIRDYNGSDEHRDAIRGSGQNYYAIGLEMPISTESSTNASNYTLIDGDNPTSQLSLLQANENATQFIFHNSTQIWCGTTVVMSYNYSDETCFGSCDAFNETASCNSNTLYYYLNTSSRTVEAVWEVGQPILSLDQSEADSIVTTTTNFTTVKVDGNINELDQENSSSGDIVSNAGRAISSPGICEGLLNNEFFGDMELNAHTPISFDESGDVSQAYLDIIELGVKKTANAYIYGFAVNDIEHSVMCNGMQLMDQSIGNSFNATKYYIYLDTDGDSDSGCDSFDDPDVGGFEYLFRYSATWSNENSQISETALSQQCSGDNWVAANVPFKADRKKACTFIGGPLFGIDKESFTSKSDVDTSFGWRAYATTAAQGGNASNVTDTVSTGVGDFKGIDTVLVDCLDPASTDNSQCTKVKQFGFFPGEFGPACLDNIDNDGDGSTDCDDTDCKYDPFFCSGSFGVQADDNSAPSFASYKVNTKNPTALSFIFNTNEPANGTVSFYNTNSSCQSINTTVLDKALLDGDSFTNYRPHHVAKISGLNPNNTYFYKLNACDPSGNCAVSKCSNATTSITHANITFKIIIPTGWAMNIEKLNLTNYSGTYALKASTEWLSNMNLTIFNEDNTSAITFVGLDIFEKQTLNLSEFVTGDDLVGLDANQYQAFKQKTGVESASIKIPVAGDVIKHCDDNGENCKTVTDNVDCTSDSTNGYTTCDVPDAVGLGFSTYQSSTAASSSSSSSSGGGSSGGSSSGGGGGGIVEPSSVIEKESRFWDQIAAGQDTTLEIDNVVIGVKQVRFSLNSDATGLTLQVASISKVDDEIPTPTHLEVFELLDIQLTNVESENIEEVAIEFAIPKSWIAQKSTDASEISLYRYTTRWVRLVTEQVREDSTHYYFEAQSPGFSNFAIGFVKPENPVIQEPDVEVADTATQQEEEQEETSQIAKVAKQVEQKIFPWVEIFVLVAIFLIVYLIFHNKKITQAKQDTKQKPKK